MTTPTYTPEQLREYAADIERHQNTVAVEGCDPAWMVARLRELAAAQSELAAIKAAVESSGDELVLELQAGMVRNGRGGPNTLQRAAAHILALRVELASVKANCKIVYWPKDGSYPIEHTMAANKDCYEMILAQMERDRAAQPKDAP